MYSLQNQLYIQKLKDLIQRHYLDKCFFLNFQNTSCFLNNYILHIEGVSYSSILPLRDSKGNRIFNLSKDKVSQDIVPASYTKNAEIIRERLNLANQQIHVENGKPLVFGENRNKGLIINDSHSAIEIIDLDKDKDKSNRLVVHDETNKFVAYLLTQMKEPDFPVAIGVLYRVPKSTLDEHYIKANKSNKNKLNAIMNEGQTWTIV